MKRVAPALGLVGGVGDSLSPLELVAFPQRVRDEGSSGVSRQDGVQLKSWLDEDESALAERRKSGCGLAASETPPREHSPCGPWHFFYPPWLISLRSFVFWSA